jgi:hypothetical protein
LISCPFRVYNFGEFTVLFNLLCREIWDCLFVCVCVCLRLFTRFLTQVKFCCAGSIWYVSMSSFSAHVLYCEDLDEVSYVILHCD